jgi:hypothetical protein
VLLPEACVSGTSFSLSQQASTPPPLPALVEPENIRPLTSRPSLSTSHHVEHTTREHMPSHISLHIKLLQLAYCYNAHPVGGCVHSPHLMHAVCAPVRSSAT